MIKQEYMHDELQSKLGWSRSKVVDVEQLFFRLPNFGANGNIFEMMDDMNINLSHEEVENVVLYIRAATEVCLEKAFYFMKITLDENTADTPKRIAKVWCGDSLECDTELGGGRFSKPVRIPSFPNTRGDRKWITKKARLISTCSHHFLPFTGDVEISYRPGNFVIGISKIQRIVNYVANRFWLQEDLTAEIHRQIRTAAKVEDEDVKVRIVAKHGCEMHRGVKNEGCDFITEE